MDDDRSARKVIGDIKTKKSGFWEAERSRRMLKLFHEASLRVPAYKDFLKKHRIDPSKIKTLKDFQFVPPVSKKNYLREYPREKLCWNGTLAHPMVFTSTSGSTGEPFYFPRWRELDWQSSIIHEVFLRNGLRNNKGPTLVLVCFGMGVWIGGLLTTEAFTIAANRGGYPVSILTPGINKAEILKALRLLAPSFSQTIITGYPPFIKDIIDEAVDAGVDLKKLHLRTLFAAESFTESFRDYIVKKGSVQSPFLDTLNVYGTADIGTMAYETPTSILARRIAVEDKGTFNDIFSFAAKTPTLAQYNPLFVNFESSDGNVLITGDNALPLVRYDIGDRGGTLSFVELVEKFKKHAKNFTAEAKQHDLVPYLSQLPFVYVYERSDFSTTLYGLQVYPEHIREALIQPSVRDFLTGKFVMSTKFDGKSDQYLELDIETRPNKKVGPKQRAKVLKVIIGKLERLNSEFRELHHHMKKRAWPRLVFWPPEDPKYFRPGVKQKWVRSQ